MTLLAQHTSASIHEFSSIHVIFLGSWFDLNLFIANYSVIKNFQFDLHRISYFIHFSGKIMNSFNYSIYYEPRNYLFILPFESGLTQDYSPESLMKLQIHYQLIIYFCGFCACVLIPLMTILRILAVPLIFRNYINKMDI